MMELDQGLKDKKEKFEKEKMTLLAQNKELRKELDKVSSHHDASLLACVQLWQNLLYWYIPAPSGTFTIMHGLLVGRNVDVYKALSNLSHWDISNLFHPPHTLPPPPKLPPISPSHAHAHSPSPTHSPLPPHTPSPLPHTQMSSNYEQTLANKHEQDTELRELRQNKELLSQWERQIADIIQWVTEEKDARAYLKTMAKKLREDVDNLKTTAGVLGRVSAVCLYHGYALSRCVVICGCKKDSRTDLL